MQYSSSQSISGYNAPLEILVVSKYAPVPGFGSNPRWFHLAKSFQEFGHKVTIVASDSNHGSTFVIKSDPITKISIDDVDYIVLKTLKYIRTASLARVLSWFHFDYRLFRHLYDVRPDVVVVSSLSLTSVLFGIFLSIFRKTVFVFEVRDIWPLTMIEEGGFNRWNPLCVLLRLIELWGYRSADLIVGTMPNLRKHVDQSGVTKKDSAFHTCGIGVPVDSTDHFHSADSLEIFRKKGAGKTIIGYCGSVGLTNNLQAFIDYIDSSIREDILFVIAGDGAHRQKFEEQLKLKDNVCFIGKIPAEQVQNFLSGCDILFLSTLPSKVWDYGQSMNKITDYMLAGKYIIAQYTGHPSHINEAGCGIFTTAENLPHTFNMAIEMSKLDRDALGKAGRNWLIENHSYEILGKEYLTKILACVKDRGTSSL